MGEVRVKIVPQVTEGVSCPRERLEMSFQEGICSGVQGVVRGEGVLGRGRPSENRLPMRRG